MAVDLSVNLGGLELRNPFVIASADIGCHLEQIKEAERYGAGAFIAKGCIPKSGTAGLSRKPRFRGDLKKGTLIGVAGFHRLSLDYAKKLISDAKKGVKIPVGVNIFVMSDTEEEKGFVTKAAKELYENGADFVELNTSPNLTHHLGETEDPEQSTESFADTMAARYPGFVYETVKSVKAVVDVPVMAKVAAENMNVPTLIRAMERGGVDIIEIMNGLSTGIVPGTLDIYNPDKLGRVFESADKSLCLAVSGEPLRMISQGFLISCAKYLHVPILGGGGIMNWRHVVEAIMCGATATASCTVFMLRGFEVLKDFEEGLRKFMEEQGYRTFDEFRGAFVDKVALSLGEINVLDAVAEVDPEKCNGCGLCTKPAHCGLERRAISTIDGVAFVDKAQCVGCETCASICPVNAIRMIILESNL